MGIHVDINKCTGCGSCVPVCPFGLIEIRGEKAHISEGCTLCGACVEACPFNAISIERETAEADSGYRGVWVFAEQHGGVLKGVSHELITKGRELADALGVSLDAICFGESIGEAAELVAHGADRVFLVEDEAFSGNNEELLSRRLAGLVREHKPEILLAGATALGRSMIPRVAAALGTGLTADCTGLEIDPEKRLLLQTRPAFGGNIMATIVCPARRPQMATVRPRVFKKKEPVIDRRGETVKVDFNREMITSRTRILDFVEDVSRTVRIEDADVVVAGGRGLGKAENFALLSELADVMGAALGSSRPPIDEGWLPTPTRWGKRARRSAPGCTSPAAYRAQCSTSRECRRLISSWQSMMTPQRRYLTWRPTASSATCSRWYPCSLTG